MLIEQKSLVALTLKFFAQGYKLDGSMRKPLLASL